MDICYQWLLNETASSSVEYALLLSGIALVVLTGVMGVGQAMYDLFYGPAMQLFR